MKSYTVLKSYVSMRVPMKHVVVNALVFVLALWTIFLAATVAVCFTQGPLGVLYDLYLLPALVTGFFWYGVRLDYEYRLRALSNNNLYEC